MRNLPGGFDSHVLPPILPLDPKWSLVVLFSSFQNRPDLVQDLFHDQLRNIPLLFRSYHLPVQALHLVDVYHPLDLCGVFDGDFEGVSHYLGSDRATEHQAGLPVIGCWRQYEGGSSARLFVSCLRVEMKPDNITPFRTPFREGIPRRSPWSFSIPYHDHESARKGAAETEVF
jgi:hypothetical protein